MNCGVFNISSLGSTATLWLTKFLNDHGAICFHALRNDPFLPSGPEGDLTRGYIEPEIMFKALLDLRERMETDKPIGLVHTYKETSSVKPAVKEIGGAHFAMIRNPVDRLNSQFTAKMIASKHFESSLASEREDFYSSVQEIYDGTEGDKKWIMSKFITLLYHIVSSDIDNVSHCEKSELIRFEDMFVDHEVLLNLVSRILEIDKSEVHIDQTQLLDKTNSHVKQGIASWSEYPEALRAGARQLLEEEFSEKLFKTTYGEMDYHWESIWEV